MSARAVARHETLGFRQANRYTAGKADWLAADLPAEGERANLTNPGMLARRDVARAERTEKIAEIRDRANSDGWDCAVVVNEESVVLGFLDFCCNNSAIPRVQTVGCLSRLRELINW